jgi:hypothetical protein
MDNEPRLQIPSPPMLIMDFSYNKAIQVKEYSYNIYLKIIQYKIETINFNNKNPQVNLMGSNPILCLSDDYSVIK